MSHPSDGPTLRNYFRAFAPQWFTLMSGPLAVPFTVAAVYVPNAPLKALFAFLALLCATVASYGIWRSERIATNKAEAALRKRDELQASLAQPTRGQGPTYLLMGELLTAAVGLSQTFPPHQSLRDILRPGSRAGTWTEDVGALWARADAELKPQVLLHEWESAFGLERPPQYGVDLGVYERIVERWIDGLCGLMEQYAQQSNAQLALADASRLPDLEIDPGYYDFTGSPTQRFVCIRGAHITNRSTTHDASLRFFVQVGEAHPTEVHTAQDVVKGRSYAIPDVAVSASAQGDVGRVCLIVRDSQRKTETSMEVQPRAR